MFTIPRSLARFRQMVKERCDGLRPLSFGQVVALTQSPIERVTIDSRSATIGIIVEPQSNGTVRVVVQGLMKGRFLPGSSVALDGFYKHPDGSVSAMLDAEFHEYD